MGKSTIINGESFKSYVGIPEGMSIDILGKRFVSRNLGNNQCSEGRTGQQHFNWGRFHMGYGLLKLCFVGVCYGMSHTGFMLRKLDVIRCDQSKKYTLQQLACSDRSRLEEVA